MEYYVDLNMEIAEHKKKYVVPFHCEYYLLRLIPLYIFFLCFLHLSFLLLFFSFTVFVLPSQLRNCSDKEQRSRPLLFACQQINASAVYHIKHVCIYKNKNIISFDLFD